MSDNIYTYNPTCEIEVANKSVIYTPKPAFRIFKNDLAAIMAYFADSNDYVITPNIPSELFLKKLKCVYKEAPLFINIDDLTKKISKKEIKVNELKPWGWSGHIHREYEYIISECSDHFRNSPNGSWSIRHKDLHSRASALNILKKITTNNSVKGLIPDKHHPVICKDHKDIEREVQLHHEIILKSPWSSSGRGIQTIKNGDYIQTIKQWATGILRSQGFVMSEPRFNKVLDAALQFNIKSESEIEYLGYTAFKTNSKNAYCGNYLNPDNVKEIQEPLKFLNNLIDSGLVDTITGALKGSIYTELHRGVIGIDTLIYNDEDGNMVINPCMEINCRYNMGTLALALQNMVHEKSYGTLYVEQSVNETPQDMEGRLSAKHPLYLEGDKIKKGYFPLVDHTLCKQYVAYMVVNC
jgi:hypothetical protein